MRNLILKETFLFPLIAASVEVQNMYNIVKLSEPFDLLIKTWKCQTSGGDQNEFTFTSNSEFMSWNYENDDSLIDISEETFSATKAVPALEYKDRGVNVTIFSNRKLN
ncbi:MAG: hypothetical protein R2757_12580 [Draconibacterium sp.]